MDDLLVGLNKAQRDAVSSNAAVLQVLAPPGSGKTKTLTARVGYLITNGLKPWNIIVCTFTVKAAKEMQERLGTLVGEEIKKKLKIGTFHGIALRYLRQYRQEAGLVENFGVADTTDSQAIVRRVLKQINDKLEPKQIRGRISHLKSKGITSEAHAAEHAGKPGHQEFVQIFSEYQAALEKCKLLDYDDILLKCVALLKAHPECVSSIEAVLVDEFQDTNRVQYELMSQLAQRRQLITIVGDPDQSIYGWRSAEIENLNLMRIQWPDTITINLEENYRSSGAILHAAQHIIEQDEARPAKKLQATHSYGHKPVLRRLPTARDEASWLVTEIKRIRALTGSLLQYNDFAVLLRAASLSRLIENTFNRDQIPYKMVGGKKFYDRKEVQIILDYIRVMDSTAHREALTRVLNTPPRGIGDATIEKLEKLSYDRKKSLWEVVSGVSQGRMALDKKLSPQADKGLGKFLGIISDGKKKLAEDPFALADVITQLVKKIDFETWIKREYKDDADTHWANVEELIAQAADSCRPVVEERDPSTQEPEPEETPVGRFLANAALASSSDDRSDAEKGNVVTISTIHAAKGLEWPIVFIPACYDGSIPHSRAENQDEERRLLYVGMTRAKGILQLSCPVKDSQSQQTTLSTFLAQSGVSSFFEERGPSIRSADAKALARVLTRNEPDSIETGESAATLEREEDDWWPLNGDEPIGYLNKDEDHNNTQVVYGTTRTSMQVPEGQGGFQTLSARFEELQAEQERIRMARLERELSDRRASQLKGSRKQIAGQGALTGFFTRTETRASTTASSSSSRTTVTEVTHIVRPALSQPSEASRTVMEDITNTASQPSLARPTVASSSKRPFGYSTAFSKASQAKLSTVSSISHTYDEFGLPSTSVAEPEPNEEQPEPQPTSAVRPASIYHRTSTSSISSGRRYPSAVNRPFKPVRPNVAQKNS